MLAGAVLAAIAAPAAWASHNFGDVPDSNPHHADISAIFGARITTGCTATLYCPGDAVTRQQMASFLRRGLGRVGASGTTANIALTTSFQTLASDSITSGGAAGGSGFIVLMGNFTAINEALPLLTDSIRIEYKLVETTTGFESNVNSVVLEPPGAANPAATGHKQWVFSIPTGTTRTYALQARMAFTPSPSDAAVTAESRHVIVMYVPFGSTGTSALSTSGQGVAAASPSNEPLNR